MILHKSGIKIGNRCSKHTPDIMGTNEEPWMTRDSINWLYNYLKKNNNLKTLLEYGCGSSTPYFLSLNLHVTSIEHNKKWLNEVSNKINTFENYIKLWTPILKELTLEGDEIGSDNECYFDDYVNEISNLENFDIIIVDGRCRSSCIKKSISHLNKNGIFIVDNAEREIYKDAIDNYIPKDWKKYVFPTKVDTTIIWIKS